MTITQTHPAGPTETTGSAIPCVTQDPREQRVADSEYLKVCAKVAVLTANSIHCPPDCGGHPVCRPCYDLGKAKGMVRSSA